MELLKEKLANVRFENLKWKNEVNFYKKELVLYLERINDLRERQETADDQNRLDDFIAQIRLFQTELGAISLFLKIYKQKISTMAKLNGALKQMTNGDHEINREQLTDFRTDYQDFKLRFQNFLKKRRSQNNQ